MDLGEKEPISTVASLRAGHGHKVQGAAESRAGMERGPRGGTPWLWELSFLSEVGKELSRSVSKEAKNPL